MAIVTGYVHLMAFQGNFAHVFPHEEISVAKITSGSPNELLSTPCCVIRCMDTCIRLHASLQMN